MSFLFQHSLAHAISKTLTLSSPYGCGFSGESIASHGTVYSQDAGLAICAEQVLTRSYSEQDSDDEDSSEEDEDTEDEDTEEDTKDKSSKIHPSPNAPSTEADINTLRTSLSGHAQLPPSSFAKRMQTANLTPTAPFVVIGRGTAGTVYEIPGTEFALKKGSAAHSIWADSQMTNTACTAVIECKTALEHHFPRLSVPRAPRVQDWVRNEDPGEWWVENRRRFEDVVEGIVDSKRGHMFCTQRIRPLPRSAREALVGAYFPPAEVECALTDPGNKSCLVRLYLGQRRSAREIERPQLTLENYPLYLDELLDIGVDIEQYTTEMAVGLAVVHWRAQLDGMDIEFVIGRAASTSELPAVVPDWTAQSPFAAAAGDFARRSIHLWMLDYDKTRPVDFVSDWKACCAQMVTAVTANDPYFPNPVKLGQEERKIWRVFEAAYVKAAQLIINIDFRLNPHQIKAAKKLPKQFIEQWKKVAQEQADAEDGGFVVFG